MAKIAGFPRTFATEICKQLGLDAGNVSELHLHFNNDGSQSIELTMFQTGDSYNGLVETIKKYDIIAVEHKETY